MTAVQRRAATAADAQQFFRMATMAHRLLEEARASGLDENARHRLTVLSDRALEALELVLPAPLGPELAELAKPLGERTATDGELRIALAELVGWLDGTISSTPFMLPESAMSRSVP